jgi:hypothetical protein
MGGLVAKEWLRVHHEKGSKCGDGQPLSMKVDRVTFIGTPFYGSPKSIKAFALGMNLLGFDDNSSATSKLASTADRMIFSKSLNIAGPSFPSVYELLPVYREQCFSDALKKFQLSAKSIETLPQPVAAVDQNGNSIDSPNIFSAAVWRKLDWPKNKSGIPDIESYYSIELPKFLENAKEFLCESINYRIPASIRVDVIYGTTEWPPTESGYSVKQTGKSFTLVDGATTLHVAGDGTVPEVIAQDLLIGKKDVTPIPIAAEHMKILTVSQFQGYIRNVLTEAKLRADLASIQTPDDLQTLAEAYGSTSDQSPVVIWETKSGSGVVNPQAFQLYQRYADIKKLSASNQSTYVKTFNTEQRMSYYAFLMADPKVKPETAGWAANNLTNLQFNEGTWSNAYATGLFFKETPAWQSIEGSNNTLLLKQFETNFGWAATKTGEYDDATKAFGRVLQLDNEWQGARYGMETVKQLKSDGLVDYPG